MKSKPVQAMVNVELVTIHDKDSPMFRAKRANFHLVSINIRTDGKNTIVREFEFTDYQKALAEYRRLKGYFV